MTRATLVVALLAAAAAPTRAALINGLVANWTFDETSGTFADATGNGHTGTAVGTAWGNGTNGILGGALELASGAHVDTSVNVTGFSAISWSIWIKTAGNLTGQRPFSLQHSAADDIRIFLGPTNLTNSHLGMDDGTPYQIPISTAGTQDNNWHLIVGTFDGTNLRAYVDGSLFGSPLPAAFNFATAAGNLSFGAQATSNASPFTGQIDEAAIWNRALTAGEVSQLWNGGAGISVIPEPSSLIAVSLGSMLLLAGCRRWQRFAAC